MTAGPLHPDNLTNGRDRDVTRGHGTRSLGPGDSSDSASDIAGAPGGTDEAAILPRGVVDDDGVQEADGADIDTDHIEQAPPDAREDGEDEAEPARH